MTDPTSPLTLEQLRALPTASVVIDSDENVYQVAGDQDGRDWESLTDRTVYTDEQLHGECEPVYLIHTGGSRSVIFADVWDDALTQFRTTMLRRSGTYEADIDLLALPNPYRSTP